MTEIGVKMIGSTYNTLNDVKFTNASSCIKSIWFLFIYLGRKWK